MDDKWANVELGKAVSKGRKCLGLTQAKLAKEVGVRRDYVERLERGKFIPSAGILTAIENFMRTTSFPDELRALKQFLYKETTPFVSALKRFRREKGMLQKDLAAKLGVGRKTVSQTSARP